MKKFLVLYMASVAEFQKLMSSTSPEEQQKGMDEWMKWMQMNESSIVEGGAPLGKTKRVDMGGSSDIKNEIGGYTIVQAESHDEAAQLFSKDHPHFHIPGAWVEIMEIMPMPGM